MYEHALIRERCEAGRQAARRRGVHLGRPRSVTDAQEARVRRPREQGRSIRQIADVVGLSRPTVHRVLRS